jgi:hypothetical protein
MFEPSLTEMPAKTAGHVDAGVEHLVAPFPFVQTRAGDFPPEPEPLRAARSDLLNGSAGGSLLISDVEDTPSCEQQLLVGLLSGESAT